MADKPLCRINVTTAGAKWCTNPVVYIVTPACACDWFWAVCAKCLSGAVKAGTMRVDQHDGRNVVRVIAVEY